MSMPVPNLGEDWEMVDASDSDSCPEPNNLPQFHVEQIKVHAFYRDVFQPCTELPKIATRRCSHVAVSVGDRDCQQLWKWQSGLSVHAWGLTGRDWVGIKKKESHVNMMNLEGKKSYTADCSEFSSWISATSYYELRGQKNHILPIVVNSQVGYSATDIQLQNSLQIICLLPWTQIFSGDQKKKKSRQNPNHK